MSLAHLENARSMHLENESLEMRASREFSRKGWIFRTRNGSRNRTECGDARSNANERTEIGEPLFLSFSRSHAECRASFRILCNKTSSLLRRFTRFTRRRRRRQMCVCSKGENNARIRFTLKTTDPFSYEQTTKNNRKRTIKTSTEAEKRKSNALAALGRNRSKRFTEQ